MQCQYGKCCKCGGLVPQPQVSPIFCECKSSGPSTITLTVDDFRKVIMPSTGMGQLLVNPPAEEDKQATLPFVPMTPEQKEDVQEKIKDTRKIVEGIQKAQQEKETEDLKSEKIKDLEARVEKLEMMMVTVSQTFTEVKNVLVSMREEAKATKTVSDQNPDEVMTEKA